MGRWARLVWLLAALGATGILIVHYQTSLVSSGYSLSSRLSELERLKEKNRILRIELGRAEVPDRLWSSYRSIAGEQDRRERNPGRPVD